MFAPVKFDACIAGETMDQSTVAIIVASIAAGVTVLGWNVSHFLASRREDRTRRIETTINRLERQIEEFYGPIFNRIEQIFGVWRVRKGILRGLEENKRESIDILIWKEYFLPLHTELRELFKAKLYLVDGASVPESFREYLSHSTGQLVQQTIDDRHVNTANMVENPWPGEFANDVRSAIKSILERRSRLLHDLE